MLVHPQFDPVALKIGPIAVRWYGLMYLVAFLIFGALGRLRARQSWRGFTAHEVEDLLFWGVFGVIVGTGCGGGLVIDGKLVDGPHGIGGFPLGQVLPVHELLDVLDQALSPPYRKLASSFLPSPVRMDSGWNWTPSMG